MHATEVMAAMLVSESRITVQHTINVHIAYLEEFDKLCNLQFGLFHARNIAESDLLLTTSGPFDVG